MVDEYQLPIYQTGQRLLGSDSSMVDEYIVSIASMWLRETVQIPLWSMNTGPAHWVSSASGRVQIPLWSMNTIPEAVRQLRQVRSDSSMVDEYLAM